MSSPRRVKSKRTGKVGYRYRFTDPATGGRTHRTFWFPEKREAGRAFAEHMASREAVRLGLPDNSGWQLPYKDFVARFLAEAPISSDERRHRLAQVLERNELKIGIVSELTKRGKLTARCRAVAKTQGDVYVTQTLQPFVKQLSAWAASIDLLPYDPLVKWKKLPRTTPRKKRRAFLPEEVRAILGAADERDTLAARRHATSTVFRAILFAGNRPGVMLAAGVRDFDTVVGRIILPEGRGKKRNGMAYLPPPFLQEMEGYLAGRGQLSADAPLFLSPTGSRPNRDNVSKEFVRCMILAFVKMCWPEGCPAAAEVEPIEVATLIEKGRVRGFDGAPPRDPVKILRRREHVQAVEEVAALVAPPVERLMHRRDFYALRKTHISWARQFVNRESVMAQVGHAPQGTEDKYYLDLVDPSQSAQAVWDVLVGEKQLRGAERRRAQLRLAVGAEGMTNSGHAGPEAATEVDPNVDLVAARATEPTVPGKEKRPQVADLRTVSDGTPERIRTSGLRFRNVEAISSNSLPALALHGVRGRL